VQSTCCRRQAFKNRSFVGNSLEPSEDKSDDKNRLDSNILRGRCQLRRNRLQGWLRAKVTGIRIEAGTGFSPLRAGRNRHWVTASRADWSRSGCPEERSIVVSPTLPSGRTVTFRSAVPSLPSTRAPSG